MFASGTDECDDEHPVTAIGKDFLLESRGGRPLEANNVQATAEERLVNEETNCDVYDKGRFGDKILGSHLLDGQDVCAAGSAKEACSAGFRLRRVERCKAGPSFSTCLASAET